MALAPRQVFEALQSADRELEAKFPLLKYQDAIGFTIWCTAILSSMTLAALYLTDQLSAWIALPAITICYSILHELEHDLIHSLYFGEKPRMQNFMFAGIWLLNGNTINPWFRKKLHLLHHRESGQRTDLEERLLGNGMPWGFKRALMTLDGTFISVFRLKPLAKELPQLKVKEFLRARVPVGFVYTLTWLSFLVLSVTMIFTDHSPFASGYGALVRALMVCLVGPNILRQCSLTFISSNSHYYGIPKMKLRYQGQVLNHWLFIPFQIFCCNFGSTHIIHHFYVTQAFYRREMISHKAHAILREAGVRFNDLASMAHANAWIEEGSESPEVNESPAKAA